MPPTAKPPRQPVETAKIIDERLISKMLRNPQFLQAFPFLANPPIVSAGNARAMSQGNRAGCGKPKCLEKASTHAINFAGIKMSFSRLDNSGRQMLLRLLGVRSVRFYIRKQSGQLVEMLIKG